MRELPLAEWFENDTKDGFDDRWLLIVDKRLAQDEASDSATRESVTGWNGCGLILRILSLN